MWEEGVRIYDTPGIQNNFLFFIIKLRYQSVFLSKQILSVELTEIYLLLLLLFWETIIIIIIIIIIGAKKWGFRYLLFVYP